MTPTRTPSSAAATIVTTLVALGLGPGLAGCATGADGMTTTATDRDRYITKIDRWHETRLARLRADDGWLTLVGLAWLEPGENGVGQSAEARVHYTGFPVDDVGTLTWHDDVVTFRPAAGVAVTGVPDDGRLATDVPGPPTILRVGSTSFYVIERSGRLAVRTKDTQAPARAAFAGIARYPVDPSWRLSAPFEPAGAGDTLPIANVLGAVDDEPLAGYAVLPVAGHSLRLALLPGGRQDRVFLVFGDTTNGAETYGGGRFLEGVLTGGGATVELDFNRAYTPPCAFTPYATCPLPPSENQLPFAVAAGEQHTASH